MLGFSPLLSGYVKIQGSHVWADLLASSDRLIASPRYLLDGGLVWRLEIETSINYQWNVAARWVNRSRYLETERSPSNQELIDAVVKAKREFPEDFADKKIPDPVFNFENQIEVQNMEEFVKMVGQDSLAINEMILSHLRRDVLISEISPIDPVYPWEINYSHSERQKFLMLELSLPSRTSPRRKFTFSVEIAVAKCDGLRLAELDRFFISNDVGIVAAEKRKVFLTALADSHSTTYLEDFERISELVRSTAEKIREDAEETRTKYRKSEVRRLRENIEILEGAQMES